MSEVKVGQTGQYVSTKGRAKPATIVATHESVEPDGDLIVPEVGHVHLLIFGLLQGWYVAPNVPLREIAEQIPDYTIDGKLVGYFEVV